MGGTSGESALPLLRLNFGSDHQVRNAFRATLLDEPSSAHLLGTQELDAADVLEVTDLAHAIAKAEEVIRARSSRVLMAGPDSSADQTHQAKRSDESGDIFDKLLGAGKRVAAEKAVASDDATDDAMGPAVHAPTLPTPLPPRVAQIPLPPGVSRPATLLRGPEMTTPIPISGMSAAATPIPAPPRAPAFVSADGTQPLAAVAIPPAARTAPILILDEDAFYHPAGRIRSLADATLDGYRPEPTLLVRLRQRRHTLSKVVLLVLAPLTLLALFAVAVGIGRASAEHASAEHEAQPTPAQPAATTPAATTPPKAEAKIAAAEPTVQVAAPAPEPTVKAAAPTPAPAPEPTVQAAAAPTPAPETTVKAAAPTSTDEIPVFDVNSLKSVPAPKPRR